VVKTLFHFGFRTLRAFGGSSHPFIISKLGSVVASTEEPGIHFHGKVRARLFRTQQQIYETSRYVTVLTEPARALWEACFPPKGNTLLVPGAVDAGIPSRGQNPFHGGAFHCVFSGNVYGRKMQPEANSVLIEKLNLLGKCLASEGARLHLIGPGDASLLDRQYVDYLGAVPYERSWDYLYFAHVGVVLAPGKYLHNNESTKIYHYLRAGLPVVTEGGFPNTHIVEEAKLGFVAPNGDMKAMASLVLQAAKRTWSPSQAIEYILTHHTWDVRAKVYDRLLQEHGFS
jgi:glycosyltransferase involved in cell wall biosynthesis